MTTMMRDSRGSAVSEYAVVTSAAIALAGTLLVFMGGRVAGGPSDAVFRFCTELAARILEWITALVGRR